MFSIGTKKQMMEFQLNLDTDINVKHIGILILPGTHVIHYFMKGILITKSNNQ